MKTFLRLIKRPCLNILVLENMVLICGSPANIQTMKAYTPDANFGIIPIPAVEEGGNAAYTVGEGTCLAISNTSENIECCKALLNFLLDKDNLTEYCTANGGMPDLRCVTGK